MKTNQDIVKQFFDAYAKRDMKTIQQVMAEDVVWTFNGNHPLAGEKHGIEEVIEFFDRMGEIMNTSKPEIHKMIEVSNNNYFIECQHIQTHRQDGINISHDACVLWTFENNKIISGKHFFADPEAVNNYFSQVSDAVKMSQ